MAALLPNVYNPVFFGSLNAVLEKHIENFNEYDFVVRVFDNQWPDLDTSDRVHRIAKALHHFLKDDFTHAASVLCRIADELASRHADPQPYIFIEDYLRTYGSGHPHLASFNIRRVRKLMGESKGNHVAENQLAESELMV